MSVICLANWYAPALSVGTEVFKEIRNEIKSYSSSSTIQWTKKLRKNYDEVIKLLKEVPPMYIPQWEDEDLTFTIHVDSSQMAIGGLLGQQVKIQDGDQKPSKVPLSGKGMPGSLLKKDPINTVIRPITYFSRVLQPNEINLPIMHLELKAMYEACMKFREFTRGGCKLKLYSDNSGVYYLLKKMLDNPNFKLDDTMAKIVALLHGTQAEIHFVNTELNPADFLTRVIPKDSNEEGKTTKKINHVQISDHELGKISENGEMAEFLMRGKASERHKPRMKLPKVSENGETEYKYNQEQYERISLENLFDRFGRTTEEELPRTGMIVNRLNMEIS